MSVLQDSAAGEAGDETSSDRAPALAGYDELTVAQVLARLEGLSIGELRRIRDHERRHGNRKPVLDAIDDALS